MSTTSKQCWNSVLKAVKAKAQDTQDTFLCRGTLQQAAVFLFEVTMFST